MRRIHTLRLLRLKFFAGVIAAVFAFFTGVENVFAAQVYDLRVENLENPLGVGAAAPRLSWKIRADAKHGIKGERQTAYQIQVAASSSALDADRPDLWDSGKVAGDASVLVPFGGKALPSRQPARWRVRVWDKDGVTSTWSPTAAFTVGLLDAADWSGEFIGAPATTGKGAFNPTSVILRKTFKVENPALPAFVQINSPGYHEVYVNGAPAAREEVLAPAVSQLNKRSLARTYDIGKFLCEGENEIVLWLGQGWFRPGLPGNVHPSPVARAQVEVLNGGKWETPVKTDATWVFANSAYNDTGNWRWNGFGGEVLDARKLPEIKQHRRHAACFTRDAFSKLQWKPVVIVAVPKHTATPQPVEGNFVEPWSAHEEDTTKAAPTDFFSAVPAKGKDTVSAKTITPAGDGKWLVDFGTTVTGWLKIEFPALAEGQEIVLEYSDHLRKGNLVGQGQVDRYIASGKSGEVFINKFNYHCFRYVKINNLKQAPKLDKTTALFIRTGFKTTSTFISSDKDLNAIHDLVERTLRALSLGGYLVDCTHFERLGYGGDGHASTDTFMTMFDVAPLYRNWLNAWIDSQQPDGGLPHTAPNPHSAGGGPYWCAFITTAPWSAYVQYGDKRFLEETYPAMQKWIAYADKYTKDGLLKRWPNQRYRNWYLGDWAVPKGMNPDYDKMLGGSVELVSNCVMVDVFEKMERIANVLDKPGDAEKYASLAAARRAKIHERLYKPETQTYGSGLQLDYIYPLLVGATPPAVRKDVENKLYSVVAERDKGHLITGLVGVAVITEWAVKNHKADFLYDMLKKREYPGYLYMLDQGATATWEHWNGERSRLHNCYNGIGAWFYQAVGGIRPDESAPGYKRFFIDPQIPKGVKWVRTTKETPYGTIELNWRITDDHNLQLEFCVPVGATAIVLTGDKPVEYASGHHRILQKIRTK